MLLEAHGDVVELASDDKARTQMWVWKEGTPEV
jgi:hypothetical protein